MTYLFFMYDRAGHKRETVRVEAESDAEAWRKAGEYADRNGWVDYNNTKDMKGVKK